MNLEEFFNSIKLDTLNEFIDVGREEDLHLDFKLATKGMTKDTKKNFAKALSGFSNSDGGIIVWGVNAKKKSDGVDVADKLEPILNLPKFINDLNSFTGQFVTPLVNGVEHKSIPAQNSKGYAKTLVPASDLGPHMAMVGEYRYYKRSGDSFYKLEHFDIADLFGRRPKPILDIDYRLLPAGNTGQNKHLDVIIGIENKGRGIARSPFLSIQVASPYHVHKYGVDGNYGFGLDKLVNARDTNEVVYGASSNVIIHPGVIRDITAIRVNVLTNQNIKEVQDLKFNYKIAADGFPLKEGQIVIPGYKLWEMANK